MNLGFKAACACNKGYHRMNNEDNLLFAGKNLPVDNLGIEEILSIDFYPNEYGSLFAVFDGIGGEADGQIASYLASEVLKTCIAENVWKSMSVPEDYSQLIQNMNNIVYQEAKRRSNRMGCTAALLCVNNDNAYMCNVGDSRIYHMRSGKLKQISIDHTDKDILIKYGITTRKPSLTQYIGISSEEMLLEPYIVSNQIAKGDRFLLCSDGLTDMVSDEEIQNIMAEEYDLSKCVESLMNLALKNGGRDNITILMVMKE